MQASKQSEPNMVEWNLRLRTRGASFGALVALCAFVPFLAGGATSAAGARNVVLAAGAPARALPGITPALVPTPDAASGEVALGGGPILFPDLALPPLAGEGGGGPLLSDDVVLAGPTGPVYGTGQLSSSMVGSAGFIRPVNAPELSGFGPRIHPVLGRAMFHTGIDLGAACSTPIRAAADGRVAYAATTHSWGNRVIIAHSPTLKTAYGHQSRMLVAAGDVVKQGQVIGLVGTTGWSTGCHLHFDVIVGNQYVDPAPYLGFAGSSVAAVPFFAPAPGRPGSGSTPAGSKNLNPPVQDGDVPLSAATKKPAKKDDDKGPTVAPSPSSTRPPSTTTTTATAKTPSSASPSPTKPPAPTSTTKPPAPTTSKPPAPTSTTKPPAPTSTSKPPAPTTSKPPAPTTTTTTPPSPTTTKTPTTGTSSSGTSPTTRPTTSASSPTTTSASPSSPESPPDSCDTTISGSDDATASTTTPPLSEGEPNVDPRCNDAKEAHSKAVADGVVGTTAVVLETASEARQPLTGLRTRAVVSAPSRFGFDMRAILTLAAVT